MERARIIFSHLNKNATFPHEDSSAVNPGPCSSVSPLSYFYTLDTANDVLTQEQRDFYEANGFLVVRNNVRREKMAKYRNRFAEICSGKEKVPGLTIMRDVAIAKSEFVPGEKAITKIQDFQFDDELFEYCCLPEIVKYVKAFLGENCMAMHTMLINKPPDPGTQTSRHPMHQDLHYFPFRPAERIVCAWTAMEKVHRGNGCLVVVPGTHKGELFEHEYPDWEGGVNKMYHGVKGYKPEKNDRIWVEMEEGDTVFFHPVLLHGSGTNTSTGFRKAISCHYAASECEYIDVKGTSQEIIADEVKEVATKRIGKELASELDYHDLWKLRARLACGKKISI